MVLVIAGLVVWRSSTTDDTAERKAVQLIAALDTAGVRTPPVDQVVRLLGADGGTVCAGPNEALTNAVTASQPADGKIVYGELLVISIYCPDKLPDFRHFVKTGG